METVNFAIHYTKLLRRVFPTVRGVGWKGVIPDEMVWVEVGGSRVGDAVCKLIEEPIAISNLPLAFLQYDSHPCPVANVGDYLDILNSFSPREEVTLDTPRQIFWFEWFLCPKQG